MTADRAVLVGPTCTVTRSRYNPSPARASSSCLGSCPSTASEHPTWPTCADMNDSIDHFNHCYDLENMSSDLKGHFDDELNTTANDNLYFAAHGYMFDLNPYGGSDFSCSIQHPHDDGCAVRCPEDSNSASQYRGTAPHLSSSYTKGRAVSVPYPSYPYPPDSSGLYTASSQLDIDQTMTWPSHDHKQESDDGFGGFLHGYGTECSGVGCPGTYCPSSCTLPQCTGANQECLTEDKCSQISCMDSDQCTPACDDV